MTTRSRFRTLTDWVREYGLLQQVLVDNYSESLDPNPEPIAHCVFLLKRLHAVWAILKDLLFRPNRQRSVFIARNHDPSTLHI